MNIRSTLLSSVVSGAIAAAAIPPAMAASHSDAPLIKQDPQANITDVYAFVGNKFGGSEKVLTVAVSVRPFSEPGDGVIYDRFADDARYSIHITDPNTGETKRRYDFRFSDVNRGLQNPNTILSYGLGTEVGSIKDVGDARQNFVQTYTVTRNVLTKNGIRRRFIGRDLLTPPPNVGARTTPEYNDPATGMAVSGAITESELDRYTWQTVYSLPTGETVFAGPREDGFYSDIPGIFDLLDSRILDNNGDLSDGLGQDGNGVDGFKGYNVLSFAIQIPVSHLPAKYFNAAFGDLGNPDTNPLPAVGQGKGVGVFVSVSRKRMTIRRSGRDNEDRGPWVQVNRMGNPLFNEALVALADKDRYNRTKPPKDAQFATYAENSELATLINTVFGTSFATSGRADLAAVFIPDVLRVDTTTDPVPLAGQSGFHRLGFIGGDVTTNAAGNVISSGWPNGRRFGDDVIDIALTAVASGPSYSNVTVVGDNVPANDQAYHQVFPYAGTPHAGPQNRKDP